MKENKYFIIFGGGGIRGISYCGAYKSLIENHISPTGYAGSSIGAVFATLTALGYDYEESYELLSNTGFEMFIDINVGFTKEIALSKGNIFLDWMKDNIEKKYYKENYQKGKMEPVKFCDLKQNLIIYSVDLTNLKFKEFSKFETPDFEIARAVRASVSMPGLFTPMELEDCLLVDGDLLKSAPLWRLSNTIKNLEERIIEFRLEDNESPKTVKNSIEYINRVYNAICGFATDYIVDLYKEKDKFDYIKINTNDVSVVDFLIPKEKREELFNTGYITTNDYFKEFFPAKRNRLKKKYNKLLHCLLNFQKTLNKTNSIQSYLTLCEIFICLCEEKQYIDTKIYEKIIEFKNEFIKNYKKFSFFGINSCIISNKTYLSEKLLEIIKIISSKTDELSD